MSNNFTDQLNITLEILGKTVEENKWAIAKTAEAKKLLAAATGNTTELLAKATEWLATLPPHERAYAAGEIKRVTGVKRLPKKPFVPCDDGTCDDGWCNEGDPDCFHYIPCPACNEDGRHKRKPKLAKTDGGER